jgi:hypothetical protein
MERRCLKNEGYEMDFKGCRQRRTVFLVVLGNGTAKKGGWVAGKTNTNGIRKFNMTSATIYHQ